MAVSGAFLGSRTTLRPTHAVAALLRLADGRYVMQLRDSNPEIFYPDHWGCFGGAVDPGETPVAALVRELAEELQAVVSPADLHPFTNFFPLTFSFVVTASGSGPILPSACRNRISPGSCSGKAPISPLSSPTRCWQCRAWSRTTLSRYGCTMHAAGLIVADGEGAPSTGRQVSGLRRP